MLILFELIALILVINREKNKSLDRLLFEANQMSLEADRFKCYEKLLQFSFRFTCLICIIIPNIYSVYVTFVYLKRYTQLQTELKMSEVEESVDFYLIFILFNRGVYMVMVFFAAIILLFLIRKYHRYEYKLHKCYFVSFALAMLLV